MFDVVTIGSATRDVFLKSRAFQIMKNNPANHDAPLGCFVLGDKIVVDEIVKSIGGASTNTAVSFARKELKVACIASIGDDASGKEILEALRKEQVEIKYIQAYSGHATDYGTILHAGGGERTILVYKNASRELMVNEQTIAQLEPRVWYLGSVDGKMSIVAQVVERAQQNRSLVAWNPGSLELIKGLDVFEPLLRGVDILILNLDEAAQLTTKHREDIVSILKVLSEAVKKYVVVTDGRKGSWVANSRYYLYSTTFPEHVIADRTGAGDAFGSGFVYGVLSTGSVGAETIEEEKMLKEALRVANANATSVIEHVGAKNILLTKRALTDDRWNTHHLSITKHFL